MTESHYDVVIMGGGIGGVFQARHLLLNIPGIKLAIVEPRSREEIAKISKIGESTVEIAGMFMVRELGLGAYLTENHLPKYGLNFHWPKDAAKTEDIGDYYSMWALKQPPIHAFQVHRGRLESDLLAMNEAMGVDIIEAKVADFDISSGDDRNAVHVEAADGTRRTLTCDHVIDAAGRAFLTGRKFDNILSKPADKFGIKNGTAWVRVKGVDRTAFHDEFGPRETATARYFGTNHFFGKGHWLWMIPLSREQRELSIGVIHHHEVIKAKQLNSREKFLAFLKANHGVLHRLVDSAEAVDFQYWGSPSHICKQVFNEDNWSALGDAIYFGDAFYSVGISALCVTIECTTELIRGKRAGEDIAEKRAAFNDYVLWFAGTNAHTYRYHPQHLGNASVMSWRITFEYLWWFGVLVPSYVGKWHLQPAYIREQLDNCPRHIHDLVYQELTEIAQAGKNVGFMDAYRADQLPFVGRSPDHEHVPYLENTSYGERALNIYTSAAATHRAAAMWWVKLQKTAWGAGWVLRPRGLRVLSWLLGQSAKIRARAALHDLEIARQPKDDPFHKLQEEFKGYSAPTDLQSW